MSVNIRVIGTVLLAALLSASCASNRMNNSIFQMEPLHDFETAPLIGVIYTTRNIPCPEATIVITSVKKEKDQDEEESQDEESYETTRRSYEVRSDINGRFMIPGVRKGRHEIVITKEGYEEGRILFEFLDMTKVFYIQMTALDTLLDEAEEFLERRETKSAEDRILRALAIDERSVEALYLSAVCYSLTDRPEKAQAALNRIKQIDPDF